MFFGGICQVLLLAVLLQNILCQAPPYPNFSNLESARTTPDSPTPALESPTPTLETPTPAPTTTPTPASSICSEYDSKVSIVFDHYNACVTAANTKSATAVVACDVARGVEDLLKACQDLVTFEAEFITLTTTKFSEFSDPNEWQIWGIGLAFEPYTFQDRTFYSPYQNNVEVSSTDAFEELSYNYYTDCLSAFGDGCTWYHQGKLRGYYDEEGGVWLVESETSANGIDQTLEAFYTPIIVDGRFFGLVFADLAYES